MANTPVCAGPCHRFLKKATHESILFNGKRYCKRCWNAMIRDSLPLARGSFMDDLQASLENDELQPTTFGLIRDKFPIERGWDE